MDGLVVASLYKKLFSSHSSFFYSELKGAGVMFILCNNGISASVLLVMNLVGSA